ncbi:cytosolic sulfotransferase 15 [Neltuma alba]|uniref:cytosolic sulfotransferase 15 n=1 Tax=Neltuma alba TaxID=207710 RepID=UPI0010A582B9|nr:cytosolic sulfotransferase 15-like [Prosopis alba]
MAKSTTASISKSHLIVELENKVPHDEACEKLSQNCTELLLSLPRKKGWTNPDIYLYKGIWYGPARVKAVYSFQKHFQAKDNDIIIASAPKSGTTWLKALTFAIVNRSRFSPSQNNHPLLLSNAHDLVPFFEFDLYENSHIPDFSNCLEPRLFGTHVRFHSLPESITESKCKIIYICRNPFDNFISFWFFMNRVLPLPSLPKLSIEEAFERYSKGLTEFGPFWINILDYWRQSKETPNKVLFMKYEDLKGDTKLHLKRVAGFLNCPFNVEEEANGVIQNIIDLCSFGKMKDLEVNKTGKYLQMSENKDFFRKGEVGDWVNHFSPWMEEKLSEVIEEKFGDSGLCF